MHNIQIVKGFDKPLVKVISDELYNEIITEFGSFEKFASLVNHREIDDKKRLADKIFKQIQESQDLQLSGVIRKF